VRGRLAAPAERGDAARERASCVTALREAGRGGGPW
jgi:hypothetical protein